MRENKVKRALGSSAIAVSNVVTGFRSVEVLRLLSKVGLDFAFVDTEHSIFSYGTTI